MLSLSSFHMPSFFVAAPRQWMKVASLAAAITVTAPSHAQDVKRLEFVADSFVAGSQFSGTVLVAKGDQVLLDKGYGAANLEWNIPNAPGTKFRLGSITKQFTAASVLLLEERGQLKLADPVSKYLAGLPAAWSKVTIAQLLNHTSGIHNFTDTKEYQGIEPFTKKPAEILTLVSVLPLDFESGSRYSYSNSGYVLLGQLIEQVSGGSYADFVQKNIFDVLGMKDSGYDWNATIVPNHAAGYSRGEKGLVNAGFINMSIPHAAGGLYSTTGDILRWQRGLYEGKLLQPASLKAMTTPYKSDYGYGLLVREVDGAAETGHDGAIEGFATEASYRFGDRISVIVLSNIEDSQLAPLVNQLAKVTRGVDVLLPSERKAVALSAAQMAALDGTYVMPQGPRFWVRVRDGQLTARLEGQRALPIFAASPELLFAREVDAQCEVNRDAAGAVEALTLVQNGRRIRMARVADVKEDGQPVAAVRSIQQPGA